MRLALLSQPDADHFLPQIEATYRAAGHDVERIVVTRENQIPAILARFDVVWCEFADQLAALVTKHAATVQNQAKIIVREHSYCAYGHVRNVDWTRVAHLIVTSEHVLEIAKATAPAIALVPTSIIPSGVDTDRFAFQAHGPDFRIGMVAYVRPEKNLYAALQILRQLRDIDERYTLDVAGEMSDPGHAAYLPHAVRSLGIEDAVRFLGPIPNEDIPGFWRERDYCLSTSLREGCPYGVLEAMACGVRPVIHEYLGAAAQFRADLVWRTEAEAVRQIDDSDYTSASYRMAVMRRYSVAGQAAALLAIVDGLGGQSPAGPEDGSQELPVCGSSPQPSTSVSSVPSFPNDEDATRFFLTSGEHEGACHGEPGDSVLDQDNPRVGDAERVLGVDRIQGEARLREVPGPGRREVLGVELDHGAPSVVDPQQRTDPRGSVCLPPLRQPSVREDGAGREVPERAPVSRDQRREHEGLRTEGTHQDRGGEQPTGRRGASGEADRRDCSGVSASPFVRRDSDGTRDSLRRVKEHNVARSDSSDVACRSGVIPAGATYLNSSTGRRRVWHGGSWRDAPLVSLAMIALVRNVAEYGAAAKAIRSVDGVADETVLVLDDRSGEFDWTGVDVVKRRPFTSFSDQRNFAADLCSGEFCLVLDADDSFESLGDLREVLESAPADIDRIECIERTVDEHGVEIETGTAVIAYRPERCRWKYRGHNALMGGDDKRMQSTAVMRYLHPWDATGKAHARRTIPLLLLDYADDPKDGHAPFFLSRCNYMLGNWAEVEKWATLTIALAPNETNYASAWFLLLNAVERLHGFQAGAEVVELAVKAHPKCPDVLDSYLRHLCVTLRNECLDPNNPYRHSMQSPRIYANAERWAEIAKAHGWVTGKATSEEAA